MLAMHELAICQALLDQVTEVARERCANRVVSVGLRIGPLAGVEPALLEQAFTVATARTLVEGAQLVIEQTAVRIECIPCGTQAEVRSNALICPSCGSWQIRVLEGEELLLMRVELC
jgi:hydrogenase nickel incorporation protein HypA/HybF